MKNTFEDLLKREFSRKEFLQFIGGSVIVVLGMSNFVNYLLHFNQTDAPRAATEGRHGFGSRKFGG